MVIAIFGVPDKLISSLFFSLSKIKQIFTAVRMKMWNVPTKMTFGEKNTMKGGLSFIPQSHAPKENN